jgi:hypothetical protein
MLEALVLELVVGLPAIRLHARIEINAVHNHEVHAVPVGSR